MFHSISCGMYAAYNSINKDALTSKIRMAMSFYIRLIKDPPFLRNQVFFFVIMP